jgi:HEAT repeat protein
MNIPDDLVDSFARHKGIIFVGPELSTLSGSPPPERLSERLAAEIEGADMMRLDENSPLHYSPIGALSFGANRKQPFEEIAQDYEIEYGREQLIARLSEHLHYAKASRVQQKLVQLPIKGVITTNYDMMLEEALKEVGREPVVIYPERKEGSNLAELEATLWQEAPPPSTQQPLYLIKLYGDLQATENLLLYASELEFYRASYPDLARLLAEMAQEHSLLYVGYEPTEESFRRLLRLTKRKPGGGQHFVLLVGANERTVVKLAQRGLRVINLEQGVRENGQLGLIEEWVTAFHEKIAGSKDEGSVNGGSTPPLPNQPYKFLDFFTRKDGALFYGREVETALLYRQVLNSRLSVLYGESATGKTSLLQAALLPRLKREGYMTIYLRPISDPLAELRQAIIQRFGKPGSGEQGDTLAALLAARVAGGGKGVVLVLDQVEGLFGLGMDGAREALMAQLMEVLALTSHRVRILLSVRSDYLDRLDELGRFLGEDPLRYRFRLQNLSLEGARAALLKPAQAFELPIEAGLEEALLKDLQLLGLTGANLQIVCQTLWEGWQAEGSSQDGLRLTQYAILGGAAQILPGYLDRMIDDLASYEVREGFGIGLDGQAAVASARLVLKRMIVAKDGQEVSQRVVTMRDLQQLLSIGQRQGIAPTGLAPKEVKALLAYLEKRGLVRRVAGGKLYELAHQVMIERIWEWFGAGERLRLNLQDVLERALIDYKAFGWRLPLNQLQLVKAHAEKLGLTHDFLHLLLVSAIEHSQDTSLWIEPLEGEDVVRLLASELAEGRRGHYGAIIQGLGLSAHAKAMPYLEGLLSDKDNKIQRQAVESLLKLELPKVAQTLYHAARQEEQLARVVPLIEGLERVRTDEAARLLSLLASDHKNPHVRSRAVSGLAYLGYRQGIGLIARLAANEEQTIREDALKAARRLWEEKPEEFEGLLGGYDTEMKLDVIRVLQMVGKEEVSGLLIERLNDGVAVVADTAARVLLELSPLAAARFEGLIGVLENEESENSKIQQIVIKLLADLGDKRALEPLLALLLAMRYPTGRASEEGEELRLGVTAALGRLYPLPELTELGSPTHQVREEAAEALAYLRDKRTIDPLMTALWDSDKGVRAAVAKALGELVSGESGAGALAGVERAITPLLIALRDKEATVRAAVALALGEMGRLPLETVSRIIEPLASKLNDEVPEVRIAVARALAQYSDGRVIAPLLTALEDEVPEVRMVVANALERLQGLPEAQRAAAAVEPLLIALGDEAARVRMAAAEALGKSGEKRAIPALEAALKDNDYLVRLSAIGALGRLYPLPMLKALGGEDGQGRREAAQALGQVGEARVVEPLMAVLADESPMVTIAAVSSLGQLADKRATPALVAILHDGSPQERMAVARALGQLADERAVEPLIKSLSDQHPKARRRAALVLGKLGSSAAVEPLIELLTDHDSQIRMAGAKALGQLDSRQAVKPLISLLSDAMHRVRSAAAKGLGNLGDRRATEPLVLLLRDDEFLVRQSATSALGELWHLPLLRQLGYYRDARARSTAASALIGEESDSPIGRLYLEALIASLQDKAPNVRIEAARALGHFKDQRAMAPLKAAKNDKNAKVRIEISRALRQLRQSKLKDKNRQGADRGAGAKERSMVDSLPALAQLKSKHATLRRIAAETLGESKDERAVEPLIQALADEEMLVRVAVVRALERFGDKRAIQPLIQSLQDEAKIVRLASVSALGVLWDLLILIQLGSERAEERRQAAIQADRFSNLQREGHLQIIEPLMATLRDEVAEIRAAATVSIGELGDKRATAALLKKLRDEDGGVRLAASEALSKLNDRRAIAPLVEALRDDEPLVRLSMIRALGSLYNLPPLYQLGALEADKRQAAAKELGGLTDGRTAEPLIALLRDESAAVRGAAANALRELGPHAIDSLLAALEESQAAGVRRHLARILGQLRKVLAHNKQKDIALRVKTLLIAALQDPELGVRQQAAISLRQLGDHQAIEQSLQDLYDPDPEIRHRAASVLGQLRDKQALGPLITACTDSHSAVREEAARSLGQLRDGRAEEPLLTLLQDEQSLVRYAATQALAQLWQESTLAQLGSSEMQIRLEAAKALGRQDNLRFLAPLGAALNDDEAAVRIAAAEALGELDDKGAIDWLVRALHDSDEEVQKSVANVLRQLEDVRDVERLIEPKVQPAYEGGTKPSYYKREEYLKQRSTVRALGALWNRPLLAQLGSERPEVRLEAARQLGQSRELYAVKPLLMALSDESLLVCHEVAGALAGFQDERIAEALIERLSTPDQKLSLIIINSLGQLGERKAAKPLLKKLNTGPLPMQLALISALGKLAAKEAIEPLEELLREAKHESLRRELIAALATLYQLPLLRELVSGDAESRRRAAMGLAEIKEARAIPLLLATLKGTHELPAVRIAVINALVALGRSNGAEGAIIAELTKCLTDDALEVRRTAIKGLGRLHQLPQLSQLASDELPERLTAIERLTLQALDVVNQPLLATLRDDDLAARLAATRALAQLWQLPALAPLGDAKADVRRQGAKALANQPNKRALRPLMAALQDPEAGVRREVVHTLGLLGDKQAIAPLIMMLSDSNSKVRGRAAAALQLLGKNNVAGLLPALENKNSKIRRHLARILGALGKKQAVTPLISLLQDANADVRQQAAISLRQLGTERAIVPTLLALRDTNPVVRQRAASVMGQLRDLRALKPLIAVLQDEMVEVRRDAARSLGQLRDLRAVKPLIKVLRDEDAEMRRRAASALKLLGDKQAISALKAIAFDEDAGTREAVQDALRVLEAA